MQPCVSAACRLHHLRVTAGRARLSCDAVRPYALALDCLCFITVFSLQDDFRARFEPMLDVPAGLGVEAEVRATAASALPPGCWPMLPSPCVRPLGSACNVLARPTCMHVGTAAQRGVANLNLASKCMCCHPSVAQGQQWPPPEAVLLPPDWPEGDLLLEEAAAEAAAAMVAAAAAAQMPPIHAANVMAGAAAEAEPAEAAAEAEAAAAATLQQAIEAVEAAEQLLQQHNPAQQAQQADQPGQQDEQVQPQPQQHGQQQGAPAQQLRRLGLFGRLLRRRRGNG